MRPIRVVPFSYPERSETLAILVRRLSRRFRTEVLVTPPTFDPETCFSADRSQYHSTRILRDLLNHDPINFVLGVTGLDLFLPVLTYVFGEAQLGGRAAVVSIHRLDPRVYGLPSSESLLVDRMEKEAVHELGHTRGLIHCPEARCVMSSSTYVEEIDLKRADFCGNCRADLETGPAVEADR